jgi:hypothetical protein
VGAWLAWFARGLQGVGAGVKTHGRVARRAWRVAGAAVVLVDHGNPKLGITTSGRAASIEEARAQFLVNWQKCRADSTPAPRPLLSPAMLSLRPRALPAGFVAPCLPTTAPHPPSGEPWLHEIKHDGFPGSSRARMAIG